MEETRQLFSFLSQKSQAGKFILFFIPFKVKERQSSFLKELSNNQRRLNLRRKQLCQPVLLQRHPFEKGNHLQLGLTIHSSEQASLKRWNQPTNQSASQPSSFFSFFAAPSFLLLDLCLVLRGFPTITHSKQLKPSNPQICIERDNYRNHLYQNIFI